MAAITDQFRNTVLHLIIDTCFAFAKPYKDATFVEGFCIPKIGNAAHECGGFELMEEGSPTVKGSLGGISFFQWTGVSKKNNRRALFMANCRKLGLHPYSYEAAHSFMMVELRGVAKNVVGATMAATVRANTPPPKDVLMARVVRFEELYERAGVKHYPSRYARAAAALKVYREWLAAGCPTPGPYIMPKARFSADFDAEFGSGEGRVTKRGPRNPYRKPASKIRLDQAAVNVVVDGVAKRAAATLQLPETLEIDEATPTPNRPVADAIDEMTKTMTTTAYTDDALEPRRLAAGLPPVLVRKGKWPEQMMSSTGIKAIQTLLRSLGYVRLGTVNGVWDSDMIAAVSKLQANAGIDVDGHYGPATLRALLDGVREVVSPERAMATRQSLREAGEPTIKATEPVATSSRWTAIGAAVSAPILGAGSYFPQALSYVQEAKAAFADVPGWVWMLGVALVALVLWQVQRRVQGTVVDGYREGAITTTAAPVLPAGVTTIANAMEGDAARLQALRRATTVDSESPSWAAEWAAHPITDRPAR